MSALRSSIANQLAAAEVVLLTILTLTALWVVTSSIGYADQSRTAWPPLLIDLLPSLVSLRTALIGVAIVGVYFALRYAGRRRFAFWAFTALLLCAHMPDLWAHNRLDWHGFFGRALYFSEPLPLYTSAALFLLTLVGLVAVHRITQLRQLAGDMNHRGVNAMERDAVIRNEAISLALVAALALVLASIVVAIGALVGQAEALTGLVPWTVATVGVAATLLLGGFLLFLYRGLSGGEPAPSLNEVDVEVSPDEDPPGYQ